ncbi:hypothetical protein HPP92_025313 [Vanilla planifolia]|uniref:Secreted protein n=1 Tax=Vanilla planifolia TaxID=51239 RepID=A0A835U7N0_VANPL|nr:hypothetical protein HPP92_025313 [Vanilla planifolia]
MASGSRHNRVNTPGALSLALPLLPSLSVCLSPLVHLLPRIRRNLSAGTWAINHLSACRWWNGGHATGGPAKTSIGTRSGLGLWPRFQRPSFALHEKQWLASGSTATAGLFNQMRRTKRKVLEYEGNCQRTSHRENHSK